MLKQQYAKLFSFSLYFLINGLFIIKYIYRVPNYNEWLLFLMYFVFGIFFLKNANFVLSQLNKKYIFFALVFLFFIFSVALNIYVDGNSLNIDRWSAMDVGVQALLNNQYPYSAIDHLGGRTSNLPTLLFIGIPFHLIGDIGFLQSFSFLILSVIINLSFDSWGEKVFCLLLAIFSPAYLYEIYCKSDLASNFIFILFFLKIFPINLVKNKKAHTLVFSFFATALVLTRLVSVIILALFGFKRFVNLNLKFKIYFIAVSIITSVLFFFVCFNNVSSLEHFLKHNPFVLQNTQLPLVVSIVLILSSLYWSFKIGESFKELVFKCIIFLFIAVSFSFLRSIYLFGLKASVLNSAFDITYFNMITPFLLVSMIFHIKTLKKQH